MGINVGGTEVDTYVGGELRKETNWWGAFVVGLAGTILVTGVVGPVLAGMGSAALPNFFIITVTGWLLCMFVAELAAMMPERTGGAPAYAYFAFKDRLPKIYPHINGVTNWMYWLGWAPVLAVNNLLIGSYIQSLFNISGGPQISLLGLPPVSLLTFALGTLIGIALFIPAYLGIRFGTGLATVLGVLTVVTLTLIAVLPFFHPSSLNSGFVWPFTTPDGQGLFSGHGIALSIQYWALLTWNVIAMEAAACYIGETKNPSRDAPIAMNLEGGFGVFIYTLIPFSMLAVLGLKQIQSDPLALFSTFVGHIFNIPGLNQIMSAALIIALALSSLNAIMGCARSVYQMSLDGQAPRLFAHVNKHQVPDVSMGFNVVLNIAIMLFGAPAVIYVFSNVGYVGSFVPVLIGYYFLRRWRPDLHRPYRLPEFMKYVALGVAALYAFIWAVGLPWCAITGCATGGTGNNLIAYFVGIAVVLAYLPLYWWRKAQDRRLGVAATSTSTIAADAVQVGVGSDRDASR
ncbi:MAG TPA: APC family permease [Candidatus Dormibacteraeota bacterium]|nr:APC family permease [Candidatus Dormibacteraeota bacterium]